KRPTEEFITDNAAAISELLKHRAAYATGGARKIAIIPSTEQSTATSKGELGSIYNKLIAVRDSLDVPLFSIPPNQAALDKIVARVASKRKKAAAPTENNTSDNTSNVPKSLIKWETRKGRLLTRMDLDYHQRNRPLIPMICFWNANGFRPKICEVHDFVSEQNPDLLLVQETKLQPGLDPLIANYRLHKDDRNNFPRSRIDGGTAIYCKNNYDHNIVPLPTLQCMDATAIEIKFNNFPPIRIVSAYARNTPENNRKFPDKDFLKILNSVQIIIAGDLIATHRTWSKARSNAFGYALRKIVNNKSKVRIVAPHTPTHINASSRPGARDSIIDLEVLKNIPFNHDIRVIDDLESDHLPVILTLYTSSALIKIPYQLSTNWENFKFLLNNKPLPVPPSSSNDDLEIAIRRLGENISEALIEASKPKFKQPP
ncbi:probable RNA-directed DNA polymerase from transposon X-element, partial [Trichonephila clavipes]